MDVTDTLEPSICKSYPNECNSYDNPIKPMNNTRKHDGTKINMMFVDAESDGDY